VNLQFFFLTSRLMKMLSNDGSELIGPEDLIVDSDTAAARQARRDTFSPPVVSILCKRVVAVRKDVLVARQHLANRLAEELGTNGCGMQ